jgi:hypothetical protein
LTFPSLIS